jgi:putative two-component system response regulator
MNSVSPEFIQSFRDLDAATRRAEEPTDPQVDAALRATARDLDWLSTGELAPASADELLRAVSALRRLSGDHELLLRGHALCNAAELLYVAGERTSSFEAAQEALRIARGAHVPLELRLTGLLGALHADGGHLGRSVECHAHVIERARALGDAAIEAAAWNQLAWTLYHGLQYEDALDGFRYAQTLWDRLQVAPVEDPQLGIAGCMLHLERPDETLEICEAASRGAAARSAAQMVRQVQVQNFRARALLALGNVEATREIAAHGQGLADASGSRRARALAAMTNGVTGIYLGRVNEGARLLRATLNEARLIKTLLHDTLHCLVVGYMRAHEPDKALAYLDEMLEENRSLGMDNLLGYLKLDPTPFQPQSGEESLKVLRDKEALLKGQLAIQRQKRKVLDSLERRAIAAELPEDVTSEHIYRVGSLAGLIAEDLGCDADLCRNIEQGARLHDIGKGSIAISILLKTEPLTPGERDEIHRHCEEGTRLLADVQGLDLTVAHEIVLHHHEWWDGRGYPKQLAGGTIPLSARITAVADAFDSATHTRAYHKALPVPQAIQSIVQAAGTQFDPDVVNAFTRVMTRLGAGEKDIETYLAREGARSPFVKARRTVSVALMLRNRGRATTS